jgi:hypothetical protein
VNVHNTNRHAFVASTVFLIALSTSGCVQGNESLMTTEPAAPIELSSTDNVVASDLIASVLDPLNALVTPSMSGKRQSGGGSEYGFAGAIAHPADKSIDVYWVGDIEPRAQAILDAAPAELTIVVHPASYRLVEMLDAVDKVVGVESSEGAARDYLILSAGPEEDGSGIWLEYQGEANEESIARIVSRMTNVTVTSATVGEPLQGQVGKKP